MNKDKARVASFCLSKSRNLPQTLNAFRKRTQPKFRCTYCDVNKVAQSPLTRPMVFCFRFINSFDESFNVTAGEKAYVNVTSHNASEYQFFSLGV